MQLKPLILQLIMRTSGYVPEVMNLNVPHPTVRRNWQTTPAGYDRRLRQDSNNLSTGDTHIPIKTMK